MALGAYDSLEPHKLDSKLPPRPLIPTILGRDQKPKTGSDPKCSQDRRFELRYLIAVVAVNLERWRGNCLPLSTQ